MDKKEPQKTMPAQDDLSAQAFKPFSADQKYQIEKKIAEGGMGMILSVLDKNMQRQVAMKVISADQSENQDHISRFIEEVQITGQLEHPNIVPTYELGAGVDGKVYYTMKLVKGKTLEDILEKLKAKKSFFTTVGYTLPKLLQVFVQICNGMSFAHSKGVIHRDLKPENIMIGEFGEVFIMDWGLAKVLGKAERPVKDTVKGVRESSMGTRTMDGTVMGTPSYMPPEQAMGEIDKIDQRSDVYGLGAILYQILTFAPPFTGKDVRQVLNDVVNKTVIPPRKRALVDIPKELEAICLKALAKDQSDRYATAKELADDIQQYLEGRSVSALPDSLPIRMMKWVRRNKTISASLAALIVVSAGLYAGLTYYQDSKTRAEISNNLSTAREYQDRNEFDKALAAYNRVLGLDYDNPYAVFGIKECKERLALIAQENQNQAVESERRNKINEILKAAQAFKDMADQSVVSELKPLEDMIFRSKALDELKQIGDRLTHMYGQWEKKRSELSAIYSEAIYKYFSVLQIDRTDETASQCLADIYKVLFDWSLKRNAPELSGDYERAILLYDRQGRYTGFLKGDGSLKVDSSPADARVYLFKLVLASDGRLTPEGYKSVEEAVKNPPQSCLIGQTPIANPITMEMGSYLLLLRKDGYADTRYPVYIERNESETADIRLVKESDIPPNMVYVPAGEYFYELNPPFKVDLPAFFISKYEVTLGDYLEYLNDSFFNVIDQRLAPYISKRSNGKYVLKDTGFRNWPLASMRLFEAQEYINWKSQRDKRKYRLPDEAEWIKAARGADLRLYAWGNAPNPDFANVSQGEEETTPQLVGKFVFDCSVYGVYDMVGNLSEWTSDSKIASGMQYSLIKGGRINNSIAAAVIDNTQLWQSNFSTFEIGFRLACSANEE